MLVPLLNTLIDTYPSYEFTFFTKRKFKGIAELINCHKVYLTKRAEKNVLKAHVEMRLKSYDKIIDLHNVIRSNVLTLLADRYARKTWTLNKYRKQKRQFIKGKRSSAVPHVVESSQRTITAAGLELKQVVVPTVMNAQSKIIAFAPGAAYVSKQFPQAKWISVLDKLKKDGYSLVMVGGVEDKKWLKSFPDHLSVDSSALDQTIAEQVDLLKTCRLFIGLDSASGHIAALAGIPIVTIWLSTRPGLGYGASFYNPQLRTDIIPPSVDGNCCPTSTHGQVPCKRKGTTCMELLSVEHVYHCINETITQHAQRSTAG